MLAVATQQSPVQIWMRERETPPGEAEHDTESSGRVEVERAMQAGLRVSDGASSFIAEPGDGEMQGKGDRIDSMTSYKMTGLRLNIVNARINSTKSGLPTQDMHCRMACEGRTRQ